jgi:hypothetical protein
MPPTTLKLTLAFLSACLAGAVAAAPVYSGDPMAARIVTEDIGRFWAAYDKGPAARVPALRDDYLAAGSPGLKDFQRVRIGSAEKLAATMASMPAYYAAFRPYSQQVAGFEPAIRASFRKLKALYPAAIFPDVYFVIGRLNSAGTYTDAGLLIGTEMMGRNPGAPEYELTPWLKSATKPVAAIPHIVAHELIHMQQTGDEQTLLARALREGICDFVGEMIADGQINPLQHAYGVPREKALWQEFAREMDGTDIGNWMYQGDRIKGERPADLGYFIGYKIAESYYAHAADKTQALAEILTFRDSRRFLADSHYEEKIAALP